MSDFSRADVAHLRRRATFGGTTAEVDALAALTTWEAVVDRGLDTSACSMVPEPVHQIHDPSMVEDRYRGSCALCGHEQVFVRELRSIRETYRCEKCRASLREREQARAIMACFPRAQVGCFAELAASPAACALDIYEPGTSGPFRALLGHLPGYQRSDFYHDPEHATADLPHQSLEDLTFPDSCFDLVITSDILEHVARPQRAFAEIARVLRPGGHHVFTIPFTYPYPPQTIVRAVIDGSRIVHLREPHYHGDGKGGRSLVFTDFGMDIVEMLRRSGVTVALQRGSTGSTVADRILTLVCTREASSPAPVQAGGFFRQLPRGGGSSG